MVLESGADIAVGSAGGWLQVTPTFLPSLFLSDADSMLQGGGHGGLSNTMGLGVDRVVGAMF